MKRLMAVFLAVSCAAAWGERIDEVLDRSQLLRLDGFELADPRAPATQRIQLSFDIARRAIGLPETVELRVVTGEVLAETVQGRVVIVNQSLGMLSDGERLFILAHELGHVNLKHWPQMTVLYQAWLPGELVQSRADAVGGLLGRDASALAYQQELEADAFSVRLLRRLGHSVEDALCAFRKMGVYNDTPTHPGTRKRVAALRMAAMEPGDDEGR